MKSLSPLEFCWVGRVNRSGLLLVAFLFACCSYISAGAKPAGEITSVSTPANADLSNLRVSNCILSPAFAASITTYTASVSNSLQEVIISPKTMDTEATVSVNNIPVISATDRVTIPLAVGDNIITVIVTAQDGITAKKYTLKIARAPSTNANLANLKVSNCILSPAFAESITSYAGSASNWLTSVKITPRTSGPTAIVYVNGIKVSAAKEPAIIPLNLGPNIITTKVIAQDGTTTKIYTLTITRTTSSDADLSNLTINSGTLNPTFSSDITSYTASVNIVKKSHTVYTMGDSITGLNEYPTTLDFLLNNLFTFVNFGIPGDVTSNMVNRFQPIIDASPDYVIIMGGTNDIGGHKTTAIQVEHNLQTMYTLAHNAGTKVIALTITPFKGHRNWSQYKQTVVDSVNTWITKTASVDYVIDTYNGLLDPANPYQLLPVYDDGDHLHPGVAGMNEIANLIYAGVKFVPNPLVDQFNAAHSSIDLTTSLSDPSAVLTLNGQTIVSRLASHIIPIAVGSNNIIAGVKAENGKTTKTYAINITGMPSSNAKLANIVINRRELFLMPLFSPDSTNYATCVEYDSIAVRAYAMNAGAALTINGVPAKSGISNISFSLVPGFNYIKILVTAQDGITVKIYTLIIDRISPSICLTDLKLSLGSISPVFNELKSNYTTSVNTLTNSIQVIPVAEDPTSTITVNGAVVASGSASPMIQLALGLNKIRVMVTGKDKKTSLTYTIMVNKVASCDASLSGLCLSSGKLSPIFQASTTRYAVSVNNAIVSITATPTIRDAGATVTINGEKVISGISSAFIPLNVGVNTIVVSVTAQDGITNTTYKVSITRAPSSNDNLSSISLLPAEAITVVPGPDYKDFNAMACNQITNVRLIPVTAVSTSIVTVNGYPVVSGSASAPIALDIGSNTITTVVTAQDGVSTHTYVITITRAAAPLNSVYQPISVSTPIDRPQMIGEEVNIHPALSPNGDGINDFLIIDGIANYPDSKLQIMNRSGQIIFEAKGYDNSTKVFDGHSDKTGAMQLPGTYFYSLDYTVNGITKHKAGFIVLKY